MTIPVRSRTVDLVFLLTLALAFPACDARPRFTTPQRLGGTSVDAATLNRGQALYDKSCRTCHGASGNGRGPNGRHQQPPPRDFTSGRFKFGSVPAGRLPTDADLVRVIRRGLAGTQMLAWDVSEDDALAVAQYIKTFSPRWRSESTGTPIALPPDPWLSRPDEARQRGLSAYHVVARCWACHPSYLDQQTLHALSSDRAIELRDQADQPLVTDSAYGSPLRAPDFRRDPLRDCNGPADIVRVVAAGIGGTGMPSWASGLSAEEIWGIAYYVESLR